MTDDHKVTGTGGAHMYRFSRKLSRRGAKAAAAISVPRPAFTQRTSQAYVGHVPREVLDRQAEADGAAEIHNPERFGSNTAPRRLIALSAAHDTNSALIGHELRGDLQNQVGELEVTVLPAALAEQDALDDLEEWGAKALRKAELARRMRSERLGAPQRWVAVGLVAVVLLLVPGDLPIIAKSFEQFDLSDQPMAFGLHLTDELHLAALASVAALLLLAHFAGTQAKSFSHVLAVRREARRQQASSAAPEIPIPTAVSAVAALVVALIVLQGLSVLRADFLATQGVPTSQTAFLQLNIGVLAAATITSYLHTHPLAKLWSQVVAEETAAAREMKRSQTTYEELAGKANSGIAQLDTLIAQAGHHVQASESNTRHAAENLVARELLALPEPVHERLYPDELPRPAQPAPDQLLAQLLGLTAIPTYSRFDIHNLIARRQELRQEIAAAHRGRDTSIPDWSETNGLLTPETETADLDLDLDLDALAPTQRVAL